MADWFETWFDSDYYHLLYKDRDDREAAQFISNLVDYIQPSKSDHFLDLACGKGRHSIFLNNLGYTVDGADYSENNIELAKQSENRNLHFYLQDMREELPKKYNVILNLFTSFGYFENDEEHAQTIQNIESALLPDGIFVLDFMNVEKVRKNLVPNEAFSRDGVKFEISRVIEHKTVIKTIKVIDEDVVKVYKEEVRAFKKNRLAEMIEASGLKIRNIFGDYNLNPFEESTSDRLIIVSEK
ncbi:class I SAM-dependent methyltransferase [bacterium]|nr:class I SAM-dependent methyltransferase [bacterium]